MEEDTKKEKRSMLRGLIRRFEREDEFSIPEQKMLVTSIYTAAKEEIIALKSEGRLPSLTKKDFPVLFAITKLGGKKTIGLREALNLTTQIVLECPDNYQRVLEGAEFTAQNMTLKNLRILVKQWNASENYVLASHSFAHKMVIELKKQKVNYKSGIAEEEQKYMKESREKVLKLSKEYKKL